MARELQRSVGVETKLGCTGQGLVGLGSGQGLSNGFGVVVVIDEVRETPARSFEQDDRAVRAAVVS
jgi:hypothetical protein